MMHGLVSGFEVLNLIAAHRAVNRKETSSACLEYWLRLGYFDFFGQTASGFYVLFMPKVICFANMKGGVGKTTLCVNLAMEMFLQRKRVLLIDNDPQFNATSGL